VEELPADVPAEAYQYALPSAEERAALAALLAPAQGAPPAAQNSPADDERYGARDAGAPADANGHGGAAPAGDGARGALAEAAVSMQLPCNGRAGHEATPGPRTNGLDGPGQPRVEEMQCGGGEQALGSGSAEAPPPPPQLPPPPPPPPPPRQQAPDAEAQPAGWEELWGPGVPPTVMEPLPLLPAWQENPNPAPAPWGRPLAGGARGPGAGRAPRDAPADARAGGDAQAGGLPAAGPEGAEGGPEAEPLLPRQTSRAHGDGGGGDGDGGGGGAARASGRGAGSGERAGGRAARASRAAAAAAAQALAEELALEEAILAAHARGRGDATSSGDEAEGDSAARAEQYDSDGEPSAAEAAGAARDGARDEPGGRQEWPAGAAEDVREWWPPASEAQAGADCSGWSALEWGAWGAGGGGQGDAGAAGAAGEPAWQAAWDPARQAAPVEGCDSRDYAPWRGAGEAGPWDPAWQAAGAGGPDGDGHVRMPEALLRRYWRLEWEAWRDAAAAWTARYERWRWHWLHWQWQAAQAQGGAGAQGQGRAQAAAGDAG